MTNQKINSPLVSFWSLKSFHLIVFFGLTAFSLAPGAHAASCDKDLGDSESKSALTKLQLNERKLELKELILELERSRSVQHFLKKNIKGIRSNYLFSDPEFLAIQSQIKNLQTEREPLLSIRRSHAQLIEQYERDLWIANKDKSILRRKINFHSGILFGLSRIFASSETLKNDQKNLEKLKDELKQVAAILKNRPQKITTLKEELLKIEAKIKSVHPNIENLKTQLEKLKAILPISETEILSLETRLAFEKEKIKTLENRINEVSGNGLKDFLKQLSAEKMTLGDLKIIMQNVEAVIPQAGTLMNDFVIGHWLLEMKTKRSTVTLALGNPFNEPGKVEEEKIRKIVGETLAAGIRIIYDADSSTAPLIRQLAGEAAVGVTGRKSDNSQLESERVVYVENPYLRWLIFTQGEIVSSLDSIIGFSGVFLNFDKSNRSLLAVEKQIEDYFSTLKDWLIKTEEIHQLGLLPLQKVAEYKPQEKRKRTKPFPIPYRGTQKWTDLATEFGVKNFFEKFQSTADLILEDYRAQAPSSYQRQAVFFGSSSVPKDFEKLVYEANEYLGSIGYSVAHGGSKGFMEVSGLGTLNGGGYSIGIPLKPGKLKNEDEFPRYAHSVTVFAPGGYEARIDLLLKNRSWVIVGAGGSGTIKEIAATLVALNSASTSLKGIVFLSNQFYRVFFDWIQNSALPKQLKERIFIVDSIEELAKVIPPIEDGSDSKKGEP